MQTMTPACASPRAPTRAPGHPLPRSAAAVAAAAAQAPDAAPTAAVAAGGQHLAFRLGAEEYGVDILRVQEIRSYEPPTRIASAPPHVKGVIDLRGVIVPIVDLRLKLGCETVEYGAATVVIVLNVAGRVVGAVVDAVSDVLELRAGQIRPAPGFGSGAEGGFITGIGSVPCGQGEGSAERMLILVDIEALMKGAESDLA